MTGNVAYHLHHVTYAPAKFEVATSKEMHNQENKFFELGVKVTQEVAQYSIHHVTYMCTCKV